MDSSSEDDHDNEVQMYVPFTCSDKRINCRIGMTLEDIESGEKFKIHQVVKVRTEDELYYQYYDIEKYQRRPRVYSRFEYTPCEEMLLEEGREGGWVRWLSKGKKRNAISPTISSKRKFDVAIPEPPVFLAIPNHVLLSASAHQTFPSSSLGPAQFVHNPGVAIPQRVHGIGILPKVLRDLKVKLNLFGELATKGADRPCNDSELFSVLAEYYRDITSCCQIVYNVAICMKLEFDRCHAAFVLMANVWEGFKNVKIRNGYLNDDYSRNVLYERHAISCLQLVTTPEYPLDFFGKPPTPVGAELYCHFLYIAASWPTITVNQLTRYIKTVYDFDMLRHVDCDNDLPSWLRKECHSQVGFDIAMHRILEILSDERELWRSLPSLKDGSVKATKAGRPSLKEVTTKLNIDVPIVAFSESIVEFPKLHFSSHWQQSTVNLRKAPSAIDDPARLSAPLHLEEKTWLKSGLNGCPDDSDILYRRVISTHEFGDDKHCIARATAAFMMQHKVISAATEKSFRGHDARGGSYGIRR